MISRKRNWQQSFEIMTPTLDRRKSVVYMSISLALFLLSSAGVIISKLYFFH